MTQKYVVLLTGGNGMVGRNIIEHATAANWDIYAPGSAELDLMDGAKTAALVGKIKPDIIIHSAGRVGGISANIAHPVEFLDTNLMIGRNIIIAAREAGVRSFLNLGSTCMYPRFGQNPLREEMILTGELEPTNEGYALAKIMTARLCQYISRADKDKSYKTLIPCNLYGKYDKFDPARAHMIPAAIHKIHQAKVTAKPEVSIWGDGTARREFMYAGDMANAVIRAADDIDGIPDLMNLGVGFDHTINAYYEVVAEVVGWTGKFVHDLSKPVGMAQKLCSVARQSAWSWKPETSLKSGIEKTYKFYLESVAQ